MVNRRAEMSRAVHDEALGRGLIRYCPICDGYEVIDQAVAVIGSGKHAVNEAEFIRSYSANVTLIFPNAADLLEKSLEQKLSNLGVTFLRGPATYEIDGDHMMVKLPSGTYKYRAIYPALGSDVRSELGIEIGAHVSPEGCLTADSHQSTNIEGLYAAGDVVKGLDQIASAIGHGSIAATAVRNYVSTKRSILR